MVPCYLKGDYMVIWLSIIWPQNIYFMIYLTLRMKKPATLSVYISLFTLANQCLLLRPTFRTYFFLNSNLDSCHNPRSRFSLGEQIRPISRENSLCSCIVWI